MHSVHASVILTLTFGTSYFLALSGIIASLVCGIAGYKRGDDLRVHFKNRHKKINPIRGITIIPQILSVVKRYFLICELFAKYNFNIFLYSMQHNIQLLTKLFLGSII